MVDIYLGLYALLAVIFALYGVIKYKTLLNVLSISICIFSISVIIAIPHYMFFSSNTPDRSIELAALISILYIFGITLPFMINASFVRKEYHKFLVYFKFDNTHRQMRYKKFVLSGFLISAGMFFLLLMIQSGAGTIWLTSPRDAYMDYRHGSGHFYALTMWALMFGYIFFLWFARPTYTAVVALFFFSFLAYYLASKGFILYFWIIFIFYWNYIIKPIRSAILFLSGILFLSLFLGSQLIQGTAKSFADTIKYFIYFDTTSIFLSKFDQVGYQFGSAFLSQFWEMVPRSLFPDKPYVYGQYIIHETLDPGMLEKGRARGTLKWTKYYLDFGIFGVFVVGFLTGLFKKTTYDYFLKHKQNPFAFMIMMQIGIITIFNYSNLLIFFILLFLFAFLIKICGSYNRHRTFVLQRI